MQTLKRCSNCDTEKPLDAFGTFNQRGKEYMRGSCNPCRAAKAREDRGDHTRALERGQYARKAAEDPVGTSRYFRDWHLRKKYGITADEYDLMAEAQGHTCATCDTHADDNLHNILYVDHNHKTGEVRGLLCQGCNTALGQAGDSPSTLRALADYLDRMGHYSE